MPPIQLSTCSFLNLVAKFGLAFDRWRMISDWIAFTEKFWGTAVERAVKKSYMRWACARWHDKVLDRCHKRAVLKRLFKRSEVRGVCFGEGRQFHNHFNFNTPPCLCLLRCRQAGLLTWGFNKLKPAKTRKEWKPRKLGVCTCVYALCHGGHCTCSWELHFTKRMKNFDSLAESADTLLYSQRVAGRKFETSYEDGLATSASTTAILGNSSTNPLSASGESL